MSESENTTQFVPPTARPVISDTHSFIYTLYRNWERLHKKELQDKKLTPELIGLLFYEHLSTIFDSAHKNGFLDRVKRKEMINRSMAARHENWKPL